MDEIQLQDLIHNCKHLKYQFLGVFAADNFPPRIPNIIFMIVNTSKSDSPGTHWIVICNRRNVLYFADPLGLPLWQYTNLFTRLNEKFHQVTELMTKYPMQDSNSTMCGSFCIYNAHLIYNKNLNGDASDFAYLNDHVLKRFLTHMLSHQLTILYGYFVHFSISF